MATISRKGFAKIANRVFFIVALISLSMSNLAIPEMIGNAANINPIKNPSNNVETRSSTFSPPQYTHPEPRSISRSNKSDIDSQPSNAECSANTPIMFIENVGQFDSRERFEVKGSNGTVRATKEGILISLLESPPSMISTMVGSQDEVTTLGKAPTPQPTPSPDNVINQKSDGVNLKFSFIGANTDSSIVGFNPLETKVSYFIGNEPDKWHPDVPVWGGIRYVNFFDGYDLEVSSKCGQWKWELTENLTTKKDNDYFPPIETDIPESSLNPIELRLKIEGSENLKIVNEIINISTNIGDIKLPLPEKGFAELKNQEPSRPQDSNETRIEGNEIILPFTLPQDPQKENSNQSFSSLYRQPTQSQGVEKKSQSGLHLASINTINKIGYSDNALSYNKSSNETLYFSTYLGGSSSNPTQNIVVDTDGNSYIVGPVTATEFPAEYGPYTTYAGSSTDLGVFKLNSTGSDLIFLTIIGGSNTDFHWDGTIDIDSSNQVYVLGNTKSSNFPYTSNAYDKTYSYYDSYLVKLNTDGTSLLYSSYLGSTSFEIGHGIDVVSASQVYITGMTASTNFPTTANAYDRVKTGNQDAYISIFNTTASGTSSLTYSTFLGGNAADQGHGIVVLNGIIYLTGQTSSTDFPTSNAYDSTSNGDYDSFVLALNPSNNNLVYSTYFGGSGVDCEISGDFRECAIAVSKEGEAYLTGITYSSNFPSLNAYDTTISGSEAYLAKFSSIGELVFSTFVGGSGGDNAFGIAVNDFGVAYLTGATDSSNFPITSDGYDQSHSGIDAFLTIFGPTGLPPIYGTFLGGSGTDKGYDIAIDENGMVYITGGTQSSDFPYSATAFDTSISGSEDGFTTAFYLPNMSVIAADQINTKCNLPQECEFGNPVQSTGTFGDPINTSTGQFFYSNKDISISIPTQSIIFERYYSSFTTDVFTSTMGYGWTHSLDTQLILPDDPLGKEGYIRFKAHSTNIYDYKENDDGSYDPMPGVVGVLSYTSSTPYTYTLLLPSQITYTFDEDGVLQMIENNTGQKAIYTYNGNDQLTRVADENNDRFLDLSYNGEGFVSNVTDHTSREITFTYNISDNLVSFIDVLGQTWEYEYDDNHNLTEIIDPDQNTVLETEYDNNGKAIKQWDGLGNQVVDITYNDNGTVTLENPLEDIQTHIYDGRGTLSEDVIATGITTTKQYDKNFNPIKITDPAGQQTELEWSDDGVNLTNIEDAEGNQTEITYDDLNNPTEVVDALNHVTTYDYDGKLLIQTTDALGEVITYTYTEEGYLQSVTNPLTQTTTYSYDDFGQLTSITNTLGIATTYEYDDLGRVINTTDTSGRVTHTDYDAASRVVKSIRNYDPLRPQNDENQYNIVTSYEYDARGNQIAVTDTYTHTTQYVYNDAGLLINTIDPLGNTITNTFNEAGQLITVTNTLGDQTIYNYDEAGRQTTITDALGNTTYTIYNPDGTIANSIDGLGHVITYTYDNLDRLISTTDELNGVTTSEYDALGNVITSTNALGDITTYEYDALGRLIKQIDSLEGETEYFYDEVGNRIQTIDPRDHATTYTYDGANRLVKVTDALGHETKYEYDDLGRQTAVTDDEDNRTEYTFDALDRVIAVSDPLSQTTTTQYDALGNVLSVTDANNNTTSYLYDDLYRQIQLTDAISATISYTYDALGNQLTSTDANGHKTTYQYDALGRNISVTDPLTNTTSTYFDAVGQVISTTNALGKITSYEYDALGRQISTTDPNGSVTEQSYDAAGNLISVTDPNDVVTKYEYDELGHLTAVVENYKPGFNEDNETNVRTEYTYDSVGNRLTINDANDNVTTFTYDELNRVVEETDPLENTWTYTYDSLGRKATVTDANDVTATYIYDDAGQLTGIDYPGTTSDVSFSYDAAGRRTQMVDSLGTTTWDYDNLNRIISVTDPFTQTVGYGYDPAGNRTSITYPDTKNITYSYNSANQLTDMTDWDEQVTQYTYDPVGKLLSIIRPNGVDTSYAYNDGGQLTQLQHTSESSELATFQYSYDDAGNRINVSENYKSIAMDSISNDQFESGDISGWSATSIDEGDLNVTAVASIEGNYGLQAIIDDTTELWVKDDNYPTNESHYRLRFYFDPNSIFMPTQSTIDLFHAIDTESETVFFIQLRSINGEYQIKVSTIDNIEQWIVSSWYPLSDEPHAIELEWQAASSPTTYDGVFTLWIDNDEKSFFNNINNNGKSIESVQLGTLSISTSQISGSIFFDDFISRRESYIGLNSNIPTPELPDLIFSNDWETGNLSNWTYVITDGGDLDVSTNAEIYGDYGMQANIDDGNDLYVLDENPLDDAEYHVRFYFNPNSVNIPTDTSFDIFKAFNINTGDVFSIPIRLVDNEYQIQAEVRDDNQQITETTWTVVSNYWHAIEVEWLSSSNSSANDGSLTLWIDDGQVGQITNLDTFYKGIGFVELGVISPMTTTITGMPYFDEYVSNRSGYIGLIPNISNIFSDAFETGNFTAWSGVVTDTGDLTITTDAPIEGTYNLRANINDINDLYVLDENPDEEFEYHARIYFDPYSISIPTDEYVNIFNGIDTNSNTAFLLRLRELDSSFQVKAIAVDDSQVNRESDWISIHDGTNIIELEWFTASEVGSNDGYLKIWVNDNYYYGILSVDNDTRLIDTIRLGVITPSTSSISGAIFFDDFVSDSSEYIGQNSEINLPLNSEIFADNFELGEYARWDQVINTNGNLSVTAQAAIEGNLGLQAIIDDNEEMYLTDFNPGGSDKYFTIIYFDPNSLTIPMSETLNIFQAKDESNAIAITLQLRQVYGEYQMRASAVDDNQQTSYTRWVTLSDEPHAIELYWKSSDQPDANNGNLNIYLDNVENWVVQYLDNDTIHIDTAQMGVISPTTSTISGTIFFDDFGSNNSSYITLNPNFSIPVLPYDIFEDDFESNDFTAWSTVVSDTGDLSVTSAAALQGSYGMQASIDDPTEIYVYDESPWGNTYYRVRFFFDPNSVYIPHDNYIDVFHANDATTGLVIRVRLRVINGQYQIAAAAQNDSQDFYETNFFDIDDAPLSVQLEFASGSNWGSYNGKLRLWINNVFQQEILDINNFSKRVDYVQLGVLSPSTTTISGTVFFDDLDSNRSGYISYQSQNRILASFDLRQWLHRAGEFLSGLFNFFHPMQAVQPSNDKTQTISQSTEIMPENQEKSSPVQPSSLSGKSVLANYMLPNPPQTTLSSPLATLDQQEMITITHTITYTYDPLSRLTAADYSDNSYYHYTYDAVGNRLSQVTASSSITYTYDIANRLTHTNAITYTWDANGNLLSDGDNTYTYDLANRLTAFTDSVNTYTYAYNGLGDRLQQTVNYTTTTYAVDIAGGLTQVLSDGTNTYLYGVWRIAQKHNSITEYYLDDALGSVRQLANSGSEVVLARAYDPYGSLVENNAYDGVTTAYGYAGEITDASGMVYLRARYYSPAQGRFVSRDVWEGDYNNPLSLNKWGYVEGNPINYTDPSGLWRWRMSSDPIYHMIIENYYGLAGGHPYKQLEYPIPNKPLRIPDMFNSKTGDVYEIEPIYLKSQGKIQVKDYVYDLAAAGEVGLLEGTYGFFKYNWNKTPFHIGTGIDWPGKYQSIFLYNPLFDLVADYVGDGVVVYWLEPDALAWTYTAKELRDIARNQKLFRRRNFYPSSPAYQPAYIIDYNNLCGQALIIVGGVIIAVTIVEDATAVGIVDDIVTIPAGYYLINYGMKLAYFYPAP